MYDELLRFLHYRREYVALKKNLFIDGMLSYGMSEFEAISDEDIIKDYIKKYYDNDKR